MNKLVILTLALILACMSFVACGGGADEEEKKITGQETLEQQEQTTPEDKAKDQPASGAFSWDNIPVYPEAVLESTGECPPQWAKCEICEHRVYVTEDAPETVCSFYKEGMPGKGWDKIVFQSYPEGSCMGTWLSSDSETRVLMNIGKRRGDKKTYIGITMGKKCP